MFWKKKKDKSQEVEPAHSWKVLKDLSQLDEIIVASQSRTQLIFKHSTRCGISAMVWRGFERKWENHSDQADLYVLDLLRFREISDEVAVLLQVFHQSPQLLVIRNGVTVAHASHGRIQDLDLEPFW